MCIHHKISTKIFIALLIIGKHLNLLKQPPIIEQINSILIMEYYKKVRINTTTPGNIDEFHIANRNHVV